MFKNVRKTIWRKLSIYISYFQHPHLTQIHSLNGFWSPSLFARICWTEVKAEWSGQRILIPVGPDGQQPLPV